MDREPKSAQGSALVLIGPAGCGKTSVGQRVAQALGSRFVDADDYHFREAVEKMRAGLGLTDADREPWLRRLAGLIHCPPEPSQDESVPQPSARVRLVLACSALKQSYRELLRVPPDGCPGSLVHFLYLKVDEQELARRLGTRAGHYAGPSLLRSQLQTLEEPHDGIIDAAQPLSAVTEDVLRYLGETSPGP